MAHFANLDDNNKVLEVIVVDNSKLLNDDGVEEEALGASFCEQLLGGRWVQTSYNSNFRREFAAIGGYYFPVPDVFVGPKLYASWVPDTEIGQWKAPLPEPTCDVGFHAVWNEDTIQWDIVANVDEPSDAENSVPPTVL
jgi:hypothetical protein